MRDDRDRLMAGGRARFPALHVPAEALPPGPELPATLSEEQCAEVYLSRACAIGDAAALAVLEREYLAPLQARLTRRARSASRADDVVQRLRVDVLVRTQDGRPPGIAAFTGAGSLASWLRIAATRILVRQERHDGRWLPAEAAPAARVPTRDDPHLAALRTRYGRELERALADAFATRPPAEQLLLRLRYTDHLGIDQVARITGGHRATVARRLRRAEEELVEHARRLLGERTGAADDDLASVLRVLRSQLDLSIAAVFGPSTGAH